MKIKFIFYLMILLLNFRCFAEDNILENKFDKLIWEIDKIGWSEEKIEIKLSEELNGNEQEAIKYYISKLKNIFSEYDNYVENINSDIELKKNREIMSTTKILKNYIILCYQEIITEIEETKNPFYKAHLIQLVFDFEESKEIFYSLLDDKTVCERANRLSQNTLQRICDLVYLFYEEGYPNKKYSELDYKIYKYSYNERDVLIKKLKKIIKSQSPSK